MPERTSSLRLAAGAAILAVLVGCAGPGATATHLPTTPAPPATPSTAPATPPPAPGPTATEAAGPTPGPTATDVRFADSPPDMVAWTPPLYDVYAPQGAQGLPMVVILPPHGIAKGDSPALAQLATAVAEQGTVAVVANWSQAEDPPAVFEDPATLEKITRLGQAVAGCAVSFAVSHARDYGADPSRLVLVGELFGANAASMVALGSPDPLPGCRATAEWKATGLVGMNGDWLATMPAWDALGPDASRAVDALSPWSTLGSAPRIPVALVVTDAAAAVAKRCDDRDAEWMVWRDPTGAMRDRLDAVGAYDDGCQDLGDAARAMAEQMKASGIPATVVRLTDADRATRTGAGGHVLELGPADLALLTETVTKVIQAPGEQP